MFAFRLLRRPAHAFVPLVLAAALAGPAAAADTRLAADLQALQAGVAETRAQLAQTNLSTAQAAQFDRRISALEQELRQMTGRLEDLDFRIRQQTQRLDRFESEANARLLRLEQGQPGGAPAAEPGVSYTPPDGSGETAVGSTGQPQSVQPGAQSGQTLGQSQGQPSGQPGPLEPRTLGTIDERDLAEVRRGGSTVQPPVSDAERQGGQGTGTQQAAAPARLPQNDPEAAYNTAFDQLRQMNYPAAESAFSQYLQLYPNSALAGNAKYWLGETHYVRGDYETAAVIFAEGYQEYPESGKAPDNLLKLGMSLANLGATQDACATFSELQRRYPNAAATVLQRAQREASRLGC
jgi:tol-pal system protein YbgF